MNVFLSLRNFVDFWILLGGRDVDGERLKYSMNEIEGLSSEDFGKVCDCVFYNLRLKIVMDEEGSFPRGHVDYRNIRFNLLIGQGTSYWTTVGM